MRRCPEDGRAEQAEEDTRLAQARDRFTRLEPERLDWNPDEVRLDLTEIDRQTRAEGRRVDVLLEINVSGEASKHGFAPQELSELTTAVQALKNVHIRGLTTMAPLQTPEQCRPLFARLRQLRDEMRRRMLPQHDMAHLSMGMSNDFEVAVVEGATLVRIGTTLFEGLGG